MKSNLERSPQNSSQMKRVCFYLLLSLAFVSNLNAQSQSIDSEMAKNLKAVSSSAEFISTINQYLSIHCCDEINRKDFNEFIKLCRCVNKKKIPVYQINTNSNGMEFYFKKGRWVYNFSLEHKNDLYFSKVNMYTFKKRRIKKNGAMAFKD